MVFRLPTPFESFIPASSGNISQSRPWRGTFVLHGINLFHGASGLQRLYVASAETEGDNRTDLWPKNFNIYLTRQMCRLSDIQAWVRSHGTPLCMFMPDRHANGPDARGNEGNFRSLARAMMDNQVICVAQWSDPERVTGAGIIIMPTPSSTGLLIGAVFLDSPFPDFILPDHSRPSGAIPAGLPSAQPYPTSYPSSNSSPSSYSPGHGPMTPPQRLYQSRADGTPPYQEYAKPSHGRPFSPLPFAHQPQNTPFSWPVIEDSSDGSGHTSPGSTYGWQ